jgi:hypothetical protein
MENNEILTIMKVFHFGRTMFASCSTFFLFFFDFILTYLPVLMIPLGFISSITQLIWDRGFVVAPAAFCSNINNKRSTNRSAWKLAIQVQEL